MPLEDSPKTTPEPPKKDKGPMDQYHYHVVQDSSSDSSKLETIYESNTSESNLSSSSLSSNSAGTSTNSESEYADITSVLMATKTEDPSASTSTPIIEDSFSDDETKTSQTKPMQPMTPLAPDHSTKPSSASWFSHLMTFPVTNGLLDFKNLLHGLISKAQTQMPNLKLSFVNSWPDLRALY